MKMNTDNSRPGGSSADSPSKKALTRRPFLIRLLRGLAVALPIVAIATWLFAVPVVSRIIDWQLKSQLASRVNAKLETASVRYLFPYGVRIEKAHLVVPDTAEGRGWGIDVGRLELTLAKLPIGGPLVIQSLDIDQPVVKLSASDSNSPATAPATPVEASTAAPHGTPAAPVAASQKLSDLFQLRRVTINNARMEFDPGSRQKPKPPVIWEHLNANMNTTPLGGGNYHFSFQAKDEPLAVIDADGALDIDTLLMDMQKLSVAVLVDPNTESSQLPPVAQELFRKFKIGGQVKFEAAAKVPLDDPVHGLYTATLSLAHGTGEVPGLDKPVAPAEFTMRCTNLNSATAFPTELPKTAQPLHLWVAGLKVCSDKKLVEINDGDIRFDPSTGVWSVQHLKGEIDTGNGPKPIVDLDANGGLDTDAMVLDMKKFSLAVRCQFSPSAAKITANGHAPSPINIGGEMNVDAIAKVPLRTPMRGLFSTRASLRNGAGTVPGLEGPISSAEVMMVCSNLPGADERSLPTRITGELPDRLAPVRLWVHKLDAAHGHRRVRIAGGELGFDSITGAWSVRGLDGLLDDGSGEQPVATVNGVGAIDVMTRVLDVQKMSIRMSASPAVARVPTAPVLLVSDKQTSPATTRATTLPIQRKPAFGGQLTLDMVGRLPLKDIKRSLISARLALVNGIAELPGVDGQISPAHFLMSFSNLGEADHKSLPTGVVAALPNTPVPMRIWIDELSADNQQQFFHANGGEGTLDLATMTWTLDHLRGLIVAGNSPGVIRDANMIVRMPLTITGSGMLFPTGSDDTIDEKSHLDLRLERGLVDVGDYRIPFRNIEGVIEFHPHEMVSKQITGTSMGGKFNASLDTDWARAVKTKPSIPTYTGGVDIVDLDLHKVAIVFTDDESLRARTTGLMDFSMRYHGSIVPDAAPDGPDSIVNQVAGSGNFDVRKGYFATIPVLRDLLDQFHNIDAATIGEAAGTFTFAKQVVTFQQAAASSPAIGVQGSGTVGFDQNVNMSFIATPLADWRADVKSSGNPFFDGLADVAGKVQGAVNKVQEKLYNFQVTGPITGPPKVTPIALPGVSDQANSFFQKMSNGMKDNAVLQELKKRVGQ